MSSSLTRFVLIGTLCSAVMMFLLVQLTSPIPPHHDYESTIQALTEVAVSVKPVVLEIHMAKTAGTERNIVLANQFERVCGHKGYSYDSYQTNARYLASGANSVHDAAANTNVIKDVYSKHYPPYSRYRVPFMLMDEIGYENCDFISNELPWQFWQNKLPHSVWAEHDIPVEFHVPCRDPLEHLMSQCNHRGLRFDCGNNAVSKNVLSAAIDECVIELHERFSFQLMEQFESLRNTIGLTSSFACFDGMKIDAYVEYMGQKRLQRKRIPTAYTPRPSNGKRNRDAECIWKQDGAFRQNLRQLLLQKFEYYQFCEVCMGSENELQLVTSYQHSH